MIGILIIAHGTLGESLIQCATHVMGTQPPLLRHIEVTAQDDPARLLQQVRQTLDTLDQGQGVLVLSDAYGATPSNLAAKLLEPGRIEGIAGVNLPMLVRALSYRNEPLETLVEKAISGGLGGIVHFQREPAPHD